MQTLKLQRLTLTYTSKYSTGALWGPMRERPIIDRVVSTPQWPVPYYQRAFKAYPIRGLESPFTRGYMSIAATQIEDSSWYFAKSFLNKSLKGRQVVQYVENNLANDTYLLVQNDVGRMAKAYVCDISLFLNSANRENKQILDSQNLI